MVDGGVYRRIRTPEQKRELRKLVKAKLAQCDRECGGTLETPEDREHGVCAPCRSSKYQPGDFVPWDIGCAMLER